jgi:hypothetical protein
MAGTQSSLRGGNGVVIMGEEKMLIPAYVRVGICKECGAHVYAPEGGGMPFMSSCQCAGERKVLSTEDRSKTAAGRGASGETRRKVKAA